MNLFKRLLRRPQDLLILVLWVVIGLIPSALFFVWIERNCSLPWIPQELGFPWLVVDGTLPEWIGVNVALLFLFGVLHSLLAVPRVRDFVFLFAHPKNHRALYVIATGMTCFLIMAHWQSTGVVIYHLFQRAVTNTLFSVLVFWALMLLLIRVSEPLGMFSFLGLTDLIRSPEEWTRSQESQAPTETLVTTGAYGRVRHPIYTLTLAAILLTPFLSLDRLLVFSVFLAYILVGYRLEERKLIKQFGSAYEEYRKKVPALFPNL